MHPHRSLRILGATLAAFVAGIHLLHPQLGLPRLIVYLQVGTLFDPRPLLFTLSGLAILAGIVLAYRGVAVEYVYLGGMLLMVTYVLGFVVWHTVLGHGAFWPHLPGQRHTELGFVENVLTHMAVEPVELVSKLAELALLAVLGVLYRIDVLGRGIDGHSGADATPREEST